MEEIKEGYTRVSQILGQWNHLAHIPTHILENKCRIGSEVHDTIAAEVEGIYLEGQEDTKGYIQSWTQWAIERQDDIEYLLTEKRFYCDNLKITGKVDAIINLGESQVIVDYKTSAKAFEKMWALQAAFYYYLIIQNNVHVDPHVMFLHLQKDGTKAKEIDIYCNEELREEAMRALGTYRYFHG